MLGALGQHIFQLGKLLRQNLMKGNSRQLKESETILSWQDCRSALL